MDTEQRNELAALERGVAFIQVVAPPLPRIAELPAYTELIQVVGEVRDRAAEGTQRVGEARATTAHKRALRRAILREHVAPRLAIAAAFPARLHTLSLQRVPSARLRDDDFLRNCQSVHRFAEDSRDELERQGMRAGFCDALGAVLGDFGAAIFARGWSRIEGVGDQLFIQLKLRRA